MIARVTIEQNSDGLYEANMEFLKDVPFGLFGQGKTIDETIADFNNSYDEALRLFDCSSIPKLQFDYFLNAKSISQTSNGFVPVKLQKDIALA